MLHTSRSNKQTFSTFCILLHLISHIIIFRYVWSVLLVRTQVKATQQEGSHGSLPFFHWLASLLNYHYRLHHFYINLPQSCNIPTLSDGKFSQWAFRACNALSWEAAHESEAEALCAWKNISSYSFWLLKSYQKERATMDKKTSHYYFYFITKRVCTVLT